MNPSEPGQTQAQGQARTQTQSQPGEPSRGLPRGLWIGTGVFALLSAAALAVSMRVGRSAIEAASAERIEKAMAESEVQADGKELRSQAMAHWNSGVIHFQAGDYAKARREWEACRRLDPSMEECQKGLKQLSR